LKVKKLGMTLVMSLMATIILNNVFTLNIVGTKETSVNNSPPKIYTHKKTCTKKIIEIYYIPHPDDETLSMGVAIANSIYKGNEVHLILLSQGFDSDTINIINGKEFCKWHKKRHNPVKEGYNLLSYYEFGMSRQKEFLNASMDLGVSKKNIHICNFYKGNFSDMDVKKIVLKYEKMYPNALHNTTSFYDYNKTHKKIAEILCKLYKYNKIKYVKFYISPNKWRKLKGIVVLNPNINSRVRKSISDYSTWEPKKSSYAIGYHSVGNQFKIVQKKLISMYVTPID
jgi:LmbE family N-acetylglucosaminyl deacetylase